MKVYVDAGLSESGAVKEVFLRDRSHTVADLDHMLDYVAVLVSRCLQHGDALEELRRSMGRHPGGRPSSLIGAALDLLGVPTARPMCFFSPSLIFAL